MAELKDKTTNPTRVRADVRFVRNLGNYETLSIDLGVERDVPDGVAYLEALRKLRAEVEAEVEAAIKEVDEEAGKVNKVGK